MSEDTQIGIIMYGGMALVGIIAIALLGIRAFIGCMFLALIFKVVCDSTKD